MRLGVTRLKYIHAAPRASHTHTCAHGIMATLGDRLDVTTVWQCKANRSEYIALVSMQIERGASDLRVVHRHVLASDEPTTTGADLVVWVVVCNNTAPVDTLPYNVCRSERAGTAHPTVVFLAICSSVYTIPILPRIDPTEMAMVVMHKQGTAVLNHTPWNGLAVLRAAVAAIERIPSKRSPLMLKVICEDEATRGDVITRVTEGGVEVQEPQGIVRLVESAVGHASRTARVNCMGADTGCATDTVERKVGVVLWVVAWDGKSLTSSMDADRFKRVKLEYDSMGTSVVLVILRPLDNIYGEPDDICTKAGELLGVVVLEMPVLVFARNAPPTLTCLDRSNTNARTLMTLRQIMHGAAGPVPTTTSFARPKEGRPLLPNYAFPVKTRPLLVAVVWQSEEDGARTCHAIGEAVYMASHKAATDCVIQVRCTVAEADTISPDVVVWVTTQWHRDRSAGEVAGGFAALQANACQRVHIPCVIVIPMSPDHRTLPRRITDVPTHAAAIIPVLMTPVRGEGGYQTLARNTTGVMLDDHTSFLTEFLVKVAARIHTETPEYTVTSTINVAVVFPSNKFKAFAMDMVQQLIVACAPSMSVNVATVDRASVELADKVPGDVVLWVMHQPDARFGATKGMAAADFNVAWSLQTYGRFMVLAFRDAVIPGVLDTESAIHNNIRVSEVRYKAETQTMVDAAAPTALLEGLFSTLWDTIRPSMPSAKRRG